MGSKLTVELFVSVDGWAGSDGLPGYFGYLGPDLEEWMQTGADQAQVQLMGRTSYTMLSELPEEARDDGWQQLTERETVVFSTTLTEVEWPHARISDDLVAEVRRLKASEENGAELRTIGSMSIVRQLLDAQLVDTFRLVTFPLIAGPPGREWAYADMASADLDLVSHRVLDDRILISDYYQTGRDIPRA